MMLFLSLVAIAFLRIPILGVASFSDAGAGNNRRRRLRMGFLPKSFSSVHIALLVVLLVLWFSLVLADT